MRLATKYACPRPNSTSSLSDSQTHLNFTTTPNNVVCVGNSQFTKCVSHRYDHTLAIAHSHPGPGYCGHCLVKQQPAPLGGREPILREHYSVSSPLWVGSQDNLALDTRAACHHLCTMVVKVTFPLKCDNRRCGSLIGT